MADSWLDRLVERFEAWRGALMPRLRRRSVLLWLIGLPVFAFGTWLLDHFFSSVYESIWAALVAASNTKVGVAALIFLALWVIVVMGLVVTSFLESSPRQSAITPRPAKLTTEEKVQAGKDLSLVNSLRPIWTNDGLTPVENMASIFFEARYYAGGLYWRCLVPSSDKLKQAKGDLVAAFESKEAPAIIIKKFNEMYGCYLSAIRWTLVLREREQVQIPNYDERIGRWKSSHGTFFNKLRDLVVHPDHRGKLAIFVESHADENAEAHKAYYDLLFEAEKRV